MRMSKRCNVFSRTEAQVWRYTFQGFLEWSLFIVTNELGATKVTACVGIEMQAHIFVCASCCSVWQWWNTDAVNQIWRLENNIFLEQKALKESRRTNIHSKTPAEDNSTLFFVCAWRATLRYLCNAQEVLRVRGSTPVLFRQLQGGLVRSVEAGVNTHFIGRECLRGHNR